MAELLQGGRADVWCRALWSSPLLGESDAPDERVIHALAFQPAHTVSVRRLGLRTGLGYAKSGDHRESDWVRDYRVLAWQDDDWRVVLEERGLPAPGDRVLWTDNPMDVGALAVQVRRAGVDGWWPSWNLTTSGILLEGEAQGTITPQSSLLQVEVGSMEDAHPGVQAELSPGQVRFRSRFVDASFLLQRPWMSHLGIDDTGKGCTERNLLHAGMWRPHPLQGYLLQGPCLLPVGREPALSSLDRRFTGTCQVTGRGVTYQLLVEGGQTYRLHWNIWEDRLILDAEREAAKPLRAWDSAAWQFSFDSRVTPVSVLGATTRYGQVGLLTPPVIIHAPGHGSLLADASGPAVLWRSDSARPQYATTAALKLGEDALPEGDYLLQSGHYRARITLAVAAYAVPRGTTTGENRTTCPDAPLLGPVTSVRPDRVPAIVREALRRCGLTALPYRADTATLSNNANSMHCPLCADTWSAVALRVGRLLPGLDAADFLQDSLQRWLDGAPGYGSGSTAIGTHLLEDEYLQTGSAALLGLAEYLQARGHLNTTRAWVAGRIPAIVKQLHRMRERDVDSDGLVESVVKKGVSGEQQWGTNWFDVISFGYKDAHANALLYRALTLLNQVLPDLGQGDFVAAMRMDQWAAELRRSFVPAFFNPESGWLGGWRDADGVLHDHAFLFVNGAAVVCGLLDPPLAQRVMERLWAECERRGPTSFRWGLPGNLLPIPAQEMAIEQARLPFGCYENGGLTLSQAGYFLSALYRVGLASEADRMLTEMCVALADGTAFGGCDSGVDWRNWDGTPSGYEGLLSDQFAILAVAMDRYGLCASADSVPRVRPVTDGAAPESSATTCQPATH